MNTKKSKNKNKTPKNNPYPSPKLDTSGKVEDVDEIPEVILKSEEERVPEITSEVEPPPEVKIPETDTPKKPKRNRGKKKKSEKEDDDDNQELKVPDPLVEGTESTSERQGDKKEMLAVKLPEETSMENIAPTARKKKNKNKKSSDQHIDEKAVEEINIIPIQNVENSVIMADVKIVTLVPVNTEVMEHETKSAKKKNKKKKHTDSEKSDKADEAIVCTAAFQKLLEPKEDKIEEKNDTKEEKIKAKNDTKDESKMQALNIESIPTEIANTEDVAQQCVLKKVEQASKPVKEPVHQTTKDETVPNKKKNKRDKKNQKFEIDMHQNIDDKNKNPSESPLISGTTDTQSEDQKIIKDTCQEQNVNPIVKEESPKPKAKIAKPVEKKRKDQSETISKTFEDIITHESSVTHQNIVPVISETKTEKENNEKLNKTSDTIEMLSVSEAILPLTEKLQQIEEAHVLETVKKGKKLTKPPKGIETKPELKETKPTMETTVDPGTEKAEKACTRNSPIPLPFTTVSPDTTAEIKNKQTTELDARDLSLVAKNQNKASDIEKLLNPFMKDGPVEVQTFQDSEIVVKTITGIEVDSQTKEQIHVPDSVMGKKRKKSPKPSRKPEVTDKLKETETAKPIELAKDDRGESNISLDLPPLEYIDTKDVKAVEPDSSICDIAPTIHYPRASSQLLDNNNNSMLIQDVTDDESKLNIPLVISNSPFIQGSGETPISTPELIPHGIQMTEIETQVFKQSEEKTDLKSKVMEVNQDMEDLRLSIERSLAELTAMEKSENEADNTLTKTVPMIECRSKPDTDEIIPGNISVREEKNIVSEIVETKDINIDLTSKDNKQIETPVPTEILAPLFVVPTGTPIPPVCPSRKDNKGKNKSKKKGKQEVEHHTTPTSCATTSASTGSTASTVTADNSTAVGTSSAKVTKEPEKEEKPKEKAESTTEKGKQKTNTVTDSDSKPEANQDSKAHEMQADYLPIENFEDALTSSVGADDVNITFEMIANEVNQNLELSQNPEISVTAPVEDEEKSDRKEKTNPVTPPKNLLGRPDIPVRLNRPDYKKEKNKTPNMRQARVKIKDSVPVEINKESKESQTENKQKFLKDPKSMDFETISSLTNDNEEYIYKYSFRKVFLPSACHVCKKDLSATRVPCNFCNLVFYCNQKHKDEDYNQHQALCFAVSTIVHLKDQKHIYGDAKGITGHNYRLLRMQMIVSCEKVLKRKLVPWEQEALLYPRVCAHAECREWRQARLKDCDGCGQISYCFDKPDHLPECHQRWCRSYSLYQKLVAHQQTKGRLEPKLPSKVMAAMCQIPEKMNEVLASMYEEKIDMNDIQYAALTQIATAPLTAVYSHQLYSNKMNATYANGVHKNSSFTIHVVGAELQFEADALNKWEVFFLHLRPDVKDLRVVLVGHDLNPSNLPLHLLGKIKLCPDCRLSKRRLIFDFQDKKSYQEYWSTDFSTPDLVCAFNPSIQRSSIYNGKDTWPATIRCIMKLKVPFIVTSYTLLELQRDLARIKECTEVDINSITEPKYNTFASVRPDRNFISDDEIPLLFKNYCFMVVCGGF